MEGKTTRYNTGKTWNTQGKTAKSRPTIACGPKSGAFRFLHELTSLSFASSSAEERDHLFYLLISVALKARMMDLRKERCERILLLLTSLVPFKCLLKILS